MSIMQKRIVNQTISRFIVKFFEPSNAECFVDNLDILELWEDFHQENAQNYIINSKMILEKFPEIFPTCQVGEYRISGVSKRRPAVKPAKHIPTAEELEEMQWRQVMDNKFGRFIESRSVDYRTSPFRVQDFANDKQSRLSGGAYFMIAEECSIEDATRYLSSLEYLYYDENTNMWHFHRKV